MSGDEAKLTGGQGMPLAIKLRPDGEPCTLTPQVASTNGNYNCRHGASKR